MRILALDFGTKTGFCYGSDVSDLVAGTWTLATPKEITAWIKGRKDRMSDPRIQNLWNHLKAIPRPDLVVFEDVQFASYTKQVQLWASFRTVAWVQYSDVRFDCVPVGTLKKFATGHGGATKEMMSEHLKKRHSLLLDTNLDDNAVDAIWIWLWARHNLGRTKTLTSPGGCGTL